MKKLSVLTLLAFMLAFMVTSCEKENTNELDDQLKEGIEASSRNKGEEKVIKKVKYLHGEKVYHVEIQLTMKGEEVVDVEPLKGRDNDGIQRLFNHKEAGVIYENESTIHMYLNDKEFAGAYERITGQHLEEGIKNFEEIKEQLYRQRGSHSSNVATSRSSCLNSLGYSLYRYCNNKTLMYQGNISNGLINNSVPWVGSYNNDQMSDLRIGGGRFCVSTFDCKLTQWVTLYQHSNYGGRRITFYDGDCTPKNISCLTYYNMWQFLWWSNDWNNDVSSFKTQLTAKC